MQIKYYQCSENTLNGTPLEPGSIYRTTDTKRFYVDPIDGGERILIGGAASGGGETVNESDIIIVSTEAYREGLEEPVSGKLYFVSESGKLYIYYDGKWNKIGSDAAGEIINPDWNQNDETASDFIKNRPFYDGRTIENILIEWDGTAKDYPAITFNETTLYKVSDDIISHETFNKDTTILTLNNGDVMPGSLLYPQMESYGLVTDDCICIAEIGFIILNPCSFGSFTFDESGIYLVNNDSLFISKIEATSIIGEVTKIDPIFLPDGIGYDTRSFTEIFEEQSVEITDDQYVDISGDNLALNLGETYNVTFDGVTYECESYSLEGMTCIGNGSIAGAEGYGNNEPFVYAYGAGTMSRLFADVGTHTIKIEGVVGELHKIDQKYLPNTRSDWNENNPESAKYIENRTHWEETVLSDSIIEEAEANCAVMAAELLYVDTSTAIGLDSTKIVAGTKYAAVFDGVTYICELNEEDQSIGNTFSNTDLNGLPFCIFFPDSYEEAFLCALKSGKHTIALYGSYVEEIHKLDKKFLPDDIGQEQVQADWNQTDETAPDFIKNKPEVNKFDSIIFIDAKTGYEYIAQVYDGNFITFRMPDDISITTMPTKTSYEVGDVFDPTGMVITATYADGTTSEITNYTYPETVTEDFKIYCIGYNKYLDLDLTISEFSLEDFEYTDNGDGTYTLTGWKGTYNGEPSTEIVIPDNENIIL